MTKAAQKKPIKVHISGSITIKGQCDMQPEKVNVFENVAEMITANVSDGDVCQTLGYHVDDDNGANLYRYHSSGRIAQDGGFIIHGSGNDDCFEAIDKSIANARQFGARATSTADDLAALQCMIDASIEFGVSCFIPEGDYRISDTLWITGTDSAIFGAPFYSATIRGDSRDGTVIIADKKDAPVFGINLARWVTVESMTIRGPNAPVPVSAADLDPDKSNWLASGVRDSQYSPQAAIAIDATVYNTPPDGGYPGKSYLGNTASGSNEVFIRDVTIEDHAVGIVVRPDGGVAQNDSVHVERCLIQRCQVGYASCNTQSRSNSAVRSCSLVACHTLFDTARFGAQKGVLPNIDSCGFGAAYRVFDASTSAGSVSLTGCYGEVLGSIGTTNFGASSSHNVLNIIDCEFQFGGTSAAAHANRPPFILATKHHALLQGCTFVRPSGPASDVFNMQGEFIVLDSCTFTETGTSKYIGITDAPRHNGITFRNCTKNYPPGPFPRSLGFPNRTGTQTAVNRLDLHYGNETYDYGGVMCKAVYPARTQIYQDPGSGYALNGTTLTFTPNDAHLFLVDDVLCASLRDLGGATTRLAPAFRVTSSGATVTAEAFIDIDRIDSVPTHGWIAQELWAPTQRLSGTTTDNSPVITDISDTTVLRVGDWIKSPAGWSGDARVIAINGDTITISTNATRSRDVSLSFCRLRALDPFSGVDELNWAPWMDIEHDEGLYGVKRVLLTDNVSLELVPSEPVMPSSFKLILKQDAAGNNSVWLMNPGELPPIDAAPNATTVLNVYFDGTDYHFV